jgi:glyoxylase-like metal-dependent hydrolase (beta-lactamase superfamily II)
LKLGDLEFHIINTGTFGLDGGAMFGVIPRPMWEKKSAPDARNRITLAMNSFLVRAGGKRILIETGAGDKLSPKLRDIYAVGEPRLIEGLLHYGIHREEVDIVVNTHLHFDHCGGNTRVEKDRVIPAFPNARYIVHKGEFEHAKNPTERDRASYMPENYMPIEAAKKFSLISDDRVIAPGVELIRVPGHVADMLCVKLHGGGKTAFLFDDLIPMTTHLGLPWIMGYDLYPMQTLENKKKWLPIVAREEWIALFCHDPNIPVAYLRERDGQYEPEPVKVD